MKIQYISYEANKQEERKKSTCEINLKNKTDEKLNTIQQKIK